MIRSLLVVGALLLGWTSHAQEVIPRPIAGKSPNLSRLVDGVEIRLVRNPQSNLLQYDFQQKNKIDPTAKSFDQVSAEQAALHKVLKTNLSQAEADQLFLHISKQNGIPFDNVILAYCFDRAQAVARLLEINGYQSQKIFADGRFVFDSVHARAGKAYWNSHVAATLQVVNQRGEIETQVIDPSIADRLLNLHEWFAILTQYSNIGCVGDSGKVYGTGTSGCLFQIKEKYHFKGDDFTQTLSGWDENKWNKTAEIMKMYYQSQVMHGKLR